MLHHGCVGTTGMVEGEGRVTKMFGVAVEDATTPQLAEGTRPDVRIQSTKGLRIGTPCKTLEQFVKLFHRFCEDSSLFIPNGARPIGAVTPFSFDLADGQSVLAGVGAVVEEFPSAENRFGRVGILIAIQQLGRDSRAVFARILATRANAQKSSRSQRASTAKAKSSPPPPPNVVAPLADAVVEEISDEQITSPVLLDVSYDDAVPEPLAGTGYDTTGRERTNRVPLITASIAASERFRRAPTAQTGQAPTVGRPTIDDSLDASTDAVLASLPPPSSAPHAPSLPVLHQPSWARRWGAIMASLALLVAAAVAATVVALGDPAVTASAVAAIEPPSLVGAAQPVELPNAQPVEPLLAPAQPVEPHAQPVVTNAAGSTTAMRAPLKKRAKRKTTAMRRKAPRSTAATPVSPCSDLDCL